MINSKRDDNFCWSQKMSHWALNWLYIKYYADSWLLKKINHNTINHLKPFPSNKIYEGLTRTFHLNTINYIQGALHLNKWPNPKPIFLGGLFFFSLTNICLIRSQLSYLQTTASPCITPPTAGTQPTAVPSTPLFGWSRVYCQSE